MDGEKEVVVSITRDLGSGNVRTVDIAKFPAEMLNFLNLEDLLLKSLDLPIKYDGNWRIDWARLDEEAKIQLFR